MSNVGGQRGKGLIAIDREGKIPLSFGGSKERRGRDGEKRKGVYLGRLIERRRKISRRYDKIQRKKASI